MANTKKKQRAANAVASQESIDSINDTIVTQPKASTTSNVSASASSASEKILNGTLSSGTSALKQPSSVVSSSSYEPPSSQPPLTTYETYRPPISLERTNPFDKNKTPVTTAVSSFSYTPVSTYTAPAPVAPIVPAVVPTVTGYKSTITSSGFDYSYKPTNPPMVYSSRDSVDKAELPPTTTTATSEEKEKSEFKRPELERKMSDADIIFGAKPTVDYSSYKYTSGPAHGRNRSNSSFTSSTTDSDYVYGSRDSRRENSFQKSLSVSSDKDGDFTHDPQVLSTRSGITNDAFSDFENSSPASSCWTAANKTWSNNDDEDFDLK